MYICKKCGEIFDEPDVMRFVEHHGEYDEPWAVDYCPECGSDEFEEAECCSNCGEYFAEEDVYGGMCENCVKDALTADLFFRWAVDGAKETKYSTFEDFMYTQIFGLDPSTCPTASSFQMREALKLAYDEFCDSRDDLDQVAWKYLKDTANVECFVEWFNEDCKKFLENGRREVR